MEESKRKPRLPLKHANFLWDFNQVFNDSILFFLRILIILVIIWGFMGNSAGKQSTCNAGDPGLIPGSGRSTGEGIGYPFQYSRASLVAQLVKNLPAMRKTGIDPWVGKILWRRERLLTLVFFTGECQGPYSPWGHKESGTTERLSLS